MKDEKIKRAFIEARAEGKSYKKIGEELGLSKSTCSSWEHSLADQIAKLKKNNQEELSQSYEMIREARIKRLGALLNKIDEAINSKDFSELPLDKLLEIRLKYGKDLQTASKEKEDNEDWISL